jgi:hypothetical protein
MNVKELSTALKREQIDFRVGSTGLTKGGDGWCTILAYKDARTDMQVLDDVLGPFNWCNEYRRDSKGVLQCGIGIYDDESPSKGFVWKWSNGTPSAFESEKGEYSDAFKRAGFMVGIGRQLYDFPQIYIMLTEKDWYKDGKGNMRMAAKFRPNDWEWEISDNYQDVTATRKFGSTKKVVFQSKPYKK